MILVIGPKECACSFKCLAKLLFWLLLRKAFLCSLYLVENCLSVCPTYALLQLGQVSLYAPDCEYGSGVWCLGVRSFPMVLFVRRAILN